MFIASSSEKDSSLRRSEMFELLHAGSAPKGAISISGACGSINISSLAGLTASPGY